MNRHLNGKVTEKIEKSQYCETVSISSLKKSKVNEKKKSSSEKVRQNQVLPREGNNCNFNLLLVGGIICGGIGIIRRCGLVGGNVSVRYLFSSFTLV